MLHGTSDKDGQEVSSTATPVTAIHFRRSNNPHPLYTKVDEQGNPVWINPIDNHVWSEEEVAKVGITHKPPKDTSDRIAYYLIRMIRTGFDIFSGYSFGPINEHKFLRRVIFLETVAGIPGMVAGSLRHLKSLRQMKRDKGWIHTLLEEAENERMHLLTFLRTFPPGPFTRASIFVTQFGFGSLFITLYVASPSTAHRLVGYIEEMVRTLPHARHRRAAPHTPHPMGSRGARLHHTTTDRHTP